MKYIETKSWLKEMGFKEEDVDAIVSYVKGKGLPAAAWLRFVEHWSELTRAQIDAMVKQHKESAPNFFLIVGQCYKESPIGCCCGRGILEVEEEESGSTYIVITEEEYQRYRNNEEECLPQDWSSRKAWTIGELKKELFLKE